MLLLRLVYLVFWGITDTDTDDTEGVELEQGTLSPFTDPSAQIAVREMMASSLPGVTEMLYASVAAFIDSLISSYPLAN
jgi:hypothetical protein